MANPPDKPDDKFTTQVEQALEAAWRGQYAPFDELVGDKSSAGFGAATIFGVLATEASSRYVGLCSGNRVGNYEIIEELGRGGMGVVYEAQQQDTGRHVALKVIRGPVNRNAQMEALFNREIRILSRLQHPGIATLFDAGSTDDGFHFFAMELVRGVSLIELVPGRISAQNQAVPTLQRRLRVFCEICDAVTHAHHHGIIHRDLKPSNVLVDETGHPKVLDFGLARMTDTDITIATGATETGQLMGTVPYMSPEQVRGIVDEIDTRSDVYSLGVMLYELVTGRRPHDLRDSHTPSLPEAARLICEETPPLPSTINNSVAGDLDTIIMKALEKDPARRYQSATALAEDIQRCLSGHAITARPPSAVYQLRKLVGRHKLATGLAGALVSLAIVSAIVLGMLAVDLGRQRDQARVEANRAMQVSAFLQDMLGAIDPEHSGPKLRVSELLGEVGDTLDTELASQPEIRASLHYTISGYYFALRMMSEAEEHAQSALDLWQSLHGRRHPSVAKVLGRLAEIANDRGNGPRYAKLATEAYEICNDLLGPDHIETTESLEGIATVHVHRGDYVQAEQTWLRILAAYRNHYGEHRKVAQALRKLAQVMVWAGRYDDAEVFLIEHLELRRRLDGEAHFEVAQALAELGEVYWQRAEYDRAEAVFRERIRMLDELVKGDDSMLAQAQCDLATALSQQCKAIEAEELYRTSLSMQRRLKGNDHGVVALASNNLARHLFNEGRFKEAEPLAADTYRIWSIDPRPNASCAFGAGNWADVLIELGRHEEAEALHQKAIDNWQSLRGNRNPKIADSIIGLGRLALLRGNRVEAKKFYEEALEIRREILGEQHPKTIRCRIRIAQMLAHDEAGPACLKALSELETAPGTQRTDLSWALCQCAGIIGKHVDHEQAAYLYRRTIAIEREIGHEMHPVLAEGLTGLGEILLQTGDPEKAHSHLSEALKIRTHCFTPDDTRVSATKAALAACSDPADAE